MEADRKLTCGEVAPIVPTFVTGDLPDSEARRLRVHLAGCTGCRAQALAADPTLIFMALKDEPLPDSFWTSFDARLRERLAAETGGWTGRIRRVIPGWGRVPRLAWLAPAAMAVLLGVTLYVSGPGGGWRTRPPRPADALQDPYRGPGQRSAGPGAVAGGGPGGVAGSVMPGPPGAPVMEDVASPGARVYRFDVGGAGDETPVYLVVDESIDI